ncbi:hypothetical protein D3C80_1086880 [compost metagenome]
MKPHLPADLPPEILRPVGGVAQLHPRPDHRPALRRQRPKLRHGRKAAARIPRPGQPPHLRPDQQSVRPLLGGDLRIVQRQPPQAPALRRAEHGRDLGRRPRAVMARHPPAPRIALAVHEDEGIEGHLQPPILQRPDRLSHALVGRRPAIGRPLAARAIVHPRNQMHLAALQTRDLPRHRLGRLGAVLHARPDATMTHAHVVAEPADDQTDPLQVRRLGHQLIQRDQQVRPPLGVMDVFRLALRQPLATHHRLGRQAKLSRAGNQTHPFQQVLQPRLARRPAKHLERQLRRAIAERPQRQILEHDIGRAAIGGRRPLDRLD